MTLRPAKILALCAAALALVGGGRATNIVSVSDEFFIVHDYSVVTISADEAKSARLYIGADQFIVETLPAAEQDELRAVVIAGLKSRVQIVSRKEEANLVGQVRMNQTTNIAIRNPKRAPAHGFVMLGLCNYPITATIANDCDSLTYFYFADDKPSDIFRRIFAKWLEAKFPASAK